MKHFWVCLCFWKTLAFDSVYKVKRCPLTTVNGHHPSAEGSNGTETQGRGKISLTSWAGTSTFLPLGIRVPCSTALELKTYTNSPLILKAFTLRLNYFTNFFDSSAYRLWDFLASITKWACSLINLGLYRSMNPYWFFFSGDLRLTQVHFSFWVPVDLML